jgi:ectoine hydroxylase
MSAPYRTSVRHVEVNPPDPGLVARHVGLGVLTSSIGTPMTAAQLAAFERDGFLRVPAALDADEVERYRTAVEAVGPERPLHRLGAVSASPAVRPLVDHPSVFGLVWSLLGWNVHVYHSHLDVHPPVPDRPQRYVWHQDGGPQNRDLESDPRPRLSVKVAWWLSDLSEPERGNLKVVPGSHLDNHLSRPPLPDVPWPEPVGAVDVLARPGDALLFDRRLWHARSDNHSALVRTVAFFAYTYRWIATREEVTVDLPAATPVQRQLLGLDLHDGDHAWAFRPDEVPLYAALRDAGLA